MAGNEGRNGGKVAACAAWGIANAIMFGWELVRDDPRWWKLLLTGFFVLTGAAGVWDGLRGAHARPDDPRSHQ